MPENTEIRLQMLREAQLINPEDNVSILRCVIGSHILVENQADADRLISGGWCCLPGPTLGGTN